MALSLWNKFGIGAGSSRSSSDTCGSGIFYLGRDDNGADHWSPGPVVWLGGAGSFKSTGFVAPSVRAAVRTTKVILADPSGEAAFWLDPGATGHPRATRTPNGNSNVVVPVDWDRLAEAIVRWHRDAEGVLIADEGQALLQAEKMTTALAHAIMSNRPLGITLMTLPDPRSEPLASLHHAILANATIVVTGAYGHDHRGIVDMELPVAQRNWDRKNPRHLVSMPGNRWNWISLRTTAPGQPGFRFEYRLPGGDVIVVNHRAAAADRKSSAISPR